MKNQQLVINALINIMFLKSFIHVTTIKNPIINKFVKSSDEDEVIGVADKERKEQE